MNRDFFDQDRPYDLILLGRIAIDLNPLDYYKTLAESETFRKYVGGSPANIAVGLSRLGKRCGFLCDPGIPKGRDRHLPYPALHERGKPGADLYGDPKPEREQHPDVPERRGGSVPVSGGH